MNGRSGTVEAGPYHLVKVPLGPARVMVFAGWIFGRRPAIARQICARCGIR
jgi:hypothetical protein